MENMGKSAKIPQILIVDDVDTNLLILENIIEGMGYIPRCAASAAEFGVSAAADSFGCVYARDGWI